MESTGQRPVTPFFNTHFFNKDGTPLKFFLDGFNHAEFYDMAKIIEAHGGELSTTLGPDTVVFCDPSRHVSAGFYNLYDIKYFHDSIVALEPQDLMNYQLQIFPNKDIHHDNGKETSEESEELMAHRTQIPTADGSNAFNDHEQSSSSQYEGEGDNKCQLFKNYSQTSRLQPMTNFHFLGIGTSSSRPVDNQMAGSSRSFPINEIGGSRCQHPYVFDGDSGYSEIPQADRDESIPKGHQKSSTRSVKQGRIYSRPTRSANSRQKLKGRPSSKSIDDSMALGKASKSSPAKRYKFYTEEENRLLIEFLVDNDAIHRARGITIWEQCLEEHKDSLNGRSARALLSHFKHKLYLEYAKYTKDPDALEKFGEIERLLKGKTNDAE